MKKSDLKSGMIVEDRSGKRGLILLNSTHGDIVGGAVYENDSGKRCWSPFSNWDENLIRTHYGGRGADIVKVWDTPHHMAAGSVMVVGNLLWERSQPKKVTRSDVETLLGYEFELVEDE